MKRFVIAGSLAVLVAAGPGAAAPGGAAPLSPSVARKIDADVARAMARFEVPGAAVMVLRDGRPAYVHAYGLRDRAARLPVTPDTSFEIGSITKQFTAAAILQLQAAGKLNIDRPLSEYLPKAPHAREVTLRQLLGHTSGLHDYLDLPDDQIDGLVQQPIAYDSLVARVADLPLDFTPGSRWAYSNTGYLLLGRVIEVASGVSYRDYLQRHILDPLQMSATHTSADEPRLTNMAKGYRHAHGALKRGPTIEASWGGAAGFLVTTLADLAKWDAALTGGRVVAPEAYREMITEATATEEPHVGYGLGFFVGPQYGQPRVGHTGGSLSFTTADEDFPRQGTRIIAFTNLGDDAPEAGEALTNIVFADLFPALVAKAQRPAAGEDAAVTKAMLAAFRDLQTGKADAAFAESLRAKLNGGLGGHFVSLVGPYGPPTAAVFRGGRETDGQHWFDYLVEFGPGVSLPFAVRLDAQQAVAGISIG